MTLMGTDETKIGLYTFRTSILLPLFLNVSKCLGCMLIQGDACVCNSTLCTTSSDSCRQCCPVSTVHDVVSL